MSVEQLSYACFQNSSVSVLNELAKGEYLRDGK